MALTSKERLLRTLRREPVDRVPISTYELNPLDTESWYYEQPSYRPLMEYFAEVTDILYMWSSGEEIFGDGETEEERWDENESTFRRFTLHTPKGPLTRVTRRDVNVNTNWLIEPLFKDVDDIDKYLSLPWEPKSVDMSGFHRAEERLGDRGIVLCDTADPICMVAGWFDFEPFMTITWEYRKKVRYLMDVLLERLLIELRYKLEHGAGPIWRIYGPEYVTQPYFPPEAFTELVVNYDRKITELIHEYGGYARIHSHGNVTQVLEQFIEMGGDATDPLEPPPQGDVDLAEVKKKYGDKLILFGNVELSFLEYWEADEIEKYVKKCIDDAGKGGGYVILPTAAPINAPLWDRTAENYRRMIETVLTYGKYD